VGAIGHLIRRIRRGVNGVGSSIGGQGRWSASGRRALIATAALVVGLTLILLTMSHRGGGSPVVRSSAPGASAAPIGPTPARPASSSIRVLVPDVTGLSALDARERLFSAGLVLARVEAVAGPPGFVMRSRPPAGQRVTPGTAVILFVAAPAERVPRDT
jgi:hypothetical protein